MADLLRQVLRLPIAHGEGTSDCAITSDAGKLAADIITALADIAPSNHPADAGHLTTSSERD